MEPFYLNSNQKKLFGTCFSLQKSNRNESFIICHPFAEEKKNTQKFIVDLAKNLCSLDYNVLLIDLNGCGDSEGDFKDATISTWILDIRNSFEYLENRFKTTNINFIGIRFSTYLGMLSIQEGLNFNRFFMIEPILDGVKYFKKTLKNKLIRELNTDGKTLSSSTELLERLKNTGSIDFDGFEISMNFYNDLVHNQSKFDIDKTISSQVDIVVFKISVVNRLNSEIEDFIKKVQSVKGATYFKLIKYVAFWNNLDPCDHDILKTEVLNACKAAQ